MKAASQIMTDAPSSLDPLNVSQVGVVASLGPDPAAAAAAAPSRSVPNGGDGAGDNVASNAASHGATGVGAVPSAASLPPPPPTPASVPAPEEEEEPYTIKCICSFTDDDGNTVLCERCETWQHIECYYPAINVPDVHNCVDCEPRLLDAKRATDRQRQLREGINLGERKPAKRPPSKSQKKRTSKDPTQTLPVNHERNGSPRDPSAPAPPPPAKRAKTSHRGTGSVSGAGHNRLRSTSNPNTNPNPNPNHVSPTPSDRASTQRIPFSQEFMRLHTDDRGESTLASNLFNSLKISDALSSWLRDPEALRDAANVDTPARVFERVDCSFESLQVPELIKHEKMDEGTEYFGDRPRWKYLEVDSFVPMGGLVSEMKGEIGLNADYVANARNRWSYLRHPEPFVFFHPQLPIHIDTRREGNRCRYVRRACRPNVTMRTIISNGTEYHFCLRAIQDLQPGTEIIMGWHYEPGVQELVRRSFQDGKLSPAERDEICGWIERVLANFGGCACESDDCLLSQILRQGQTQGRQVNGTKAKKSRKAKTQASPSKQPSVNPEGRITPREVDDDVREREREESRSTSESSRSKPQSRDRTPSHEMSPSKNEPEISSREKRKIAALEKKFEQMQHDHEHAQKRKKRGSAVSQTPGKQLVSLPATPCFPPTKPAFYADASTSSGKPTSPSSARDAGSLLKRTPGDSGSPHARPAVSSSGRPNYTDSSTQTEGDEAWYHQKPKSKPPPPRRPFVSLSQHILRKFHADKVRLRESATAEAQAQASDPQPSTPVTTQTQTSSSPQDPMSPDSGGDAAKETQGHVQLPNGYRSADLRVQLPPAPQFSAPTASGSPSATFSPGAVPGSVFSPSVVNAIHSSSPVKKKLSLSEYTRRSATTKAETPVGEKSNLGLHTSSASPTSQVDMGISENVVESPTNEPDVMNTD